MHSVFLIGDAGDSKMGEVAPALRGLERILDVNSKDHSVVFLGDNIYPDGMPDEKHQNREEAEWALKVQLDLIKNIKGHPVIIPGNHDWHKGLAGIKRQEKFITSYLDEKDVFLPEDGCAGPEVVELTDDLLLVVMDSEWWLRDWDKEPLINIDCEIKTREGLITAYTNILKKNRSKDIIVAFHHPLFSYGPHGGYYSFSDHIFPLTKVINNFYLPLPVLGSLYPLIVGNAGRKGDLDFLPFVDFKNKILAASRGYENLIFVSGHEHNLQYIVQQRHPFIISGSGSKRNRLHKGPNLVYGHTDPGFVRLDAYDDGSIWTTFYTVSESGAPTEVFTSEIKSPNKKVEQFDFAEFEKGMDTVETSIYPPSETDKSGFYRMFWGEWYREVYGKKIKVPTLDLSSTKGGLVPVRRGGGMQTSSVRLEDSEGRQYALRGMQKNAANLLPGAFQNTFVSDLMRDFFTTAHPYAAFIIPTLADAVNVYHANPKLVYVPKQPALGKYNQDFGNGLYLFEERPANDRSDVASFGRSKDIISSVDLLDKLEKNDNHQLDNQWIIRSRMFDLVLSDWDRHQDQWRWASFKDKKEDKTIYRPIPRDRDQAFARFDGLFTSLATRSLINLRPMQRFPGYTKKVHWLTWGTRFFDRRFLNETTWEDWEREIEFIQENLTDQTIDKALAEWPQVIYEVQGDRISRTLKQRRDNLMEMGRQLYDFISKDVDVVGTNKSDYFLVEHHSDQETRIRVFRDGDKEKEDKIYDRVFKSSETRSIQLYGLEGKDDFEVVGEGKSPIKIRMIGGPDEDAFEDDTRGGKKTRVYDDLTGGDEVEGKNIVDKRSNRHLLNEYNFKEFQYNYSLAVPYAAFYTDDGFFFGGFLTHQVSEFKKQPYGQSHSFGINYALATQAFQFSWKGRFVNSIGKWDLTPSVLFQTPRYSQNFYGLGNETSYTEDEEYYRVRNKIFRFAAGLEKKSRGGSSLQFLPYYEQIKVEKTDDRLISLEEIPVRDAIFSNQSYLGIEAIFRHRNTTNLAYPTRGMNFEGGIRWKKNLSANDRDFFKLDQQLSLYLPVTRNELVVFATHFTATQILGEFDFYHGSTLGGLQTLRGLRIERLTGRASLAHSNDLRIPIARVRNNIIPFAIGITGSFDYGRIYHDLESSNKWHTSYGASVWFNFVNAAVIRLGLHQSSDGGRFVAGLGYAF